MGGSSSSSSRQSTENVDKRWVVGEGAAGVNVEGSSGVSVNITDGGIVSRALDSIDLSNAIQYEGFTKLLEAGESLIGQTQKHVADAYKQAQTETRGTIDNRTMIVLAVVAGAAIVATRGRA